MSETATQYSLLGDDEGNLLPEDQLEGKANSAVAKLSEVTDPKSTYAALVGLSKDDVSYLVDNYREKIGLVNTLRMFACQPLWISQAIAKETSEAIVRSGIEFPEDIKMIIESHAADLVRERMVSKLRNSMMTRT